MKKDQLKSRITRLETVRTKEDKELIKMISDKKTEIDKLVVNIKSSSEKNLKKARNLRKEIAQIMTIMKEKEILEREAKSNEG